MFANWNKRMNKYISRWREYIQKMVINNGDKNEKINSERKKMKKLKKMKLLMLKIKMKMK